MRPVINSRLLKIKRDHRSIQMSLTLPSRTNSISKCVSCTNGRRTSRTQSDYYLGGVPRFHSYTVAANQAQRSWSKHNHINVGSISRTFWLPKTTGYTWLWCRKCSQPRWLDGSENILPGKAEDLCWCLKLMDGQVIVATPAKVNVCVVHLRPGNCFLKQPSPYTLTDPVYDTVHHLKIACRYLANVKNWPT